MDVWPFVVAMHDILSFSFFHFTPSKEYIGIFEGDERSGVNTLLDQANPAEVFPSFELITQNGLSSPHP